MAMGFYENNDTIEYFMEDLAQEIAAAPEATKAFEAAGAGDELTPEQQKIVQPIVLEVANFFITLRAFDRFALELWQFNAIVNPLLRHGGASGWSCGVLTHEVLNGVSVRTGRLLLRTASWNFRLISGLVHVLLALLAGGTSAAELELPRAFLERHKDTVVVEVTATVKAVVPHRSRNVCDLHVVLDAETDWLGGLPLVGDIEDGHSYPADIGLKTGERSTTVRGVLRLWLEKHPGVGPMGAEEALASSETGARAHQIVQGPKALRGAPPPSLGRWPQRPLGARESRVRRCETKSWSGSASEGPIPAPPHRGVRAKQTGVHSTQNASNPVPAFRFECAQARARRADERRLACAC